MPGPDDTYSSYGLRWASLSNTPFRRHKSWVHEGGIATPCIMHWPDGITSSGRLCRDVAHIIDLMPTFLALAEPKRPDAARTLPKQKLPGTSLLPVLHGGSLGQRCLCWEHEGNRAIRVGRWKLVSEYPGEWTYFYTYPNQGRWELYDLANDRTELNNLAGQRPALVKELSEAYKAWARSNRVVPWDELSGKRR